MIAPIPAMQAVDPGSPGAGADTDGRPGAFDGRGRPLPPDPRPQPVLVGDPGRISGKRREPARRPDAAEGSRSSAMPVRDGRRRARALHRRWRPEAVRPIGKRREPACKPGSVGGSHSSATHVAVRL